jgi:hypothetical protein
MPDIECPVCSNQLKTVPIDSQRAFSKRYDCLQCGKYELSDLAEEDTNLHDSKQFISAWIRLQNKRGNRPFIGDNFIMEDWFKNLRNMGFPQTVNEKLNALLKAYADIVKDDYQRIVAVEQHLELVSDIAAKNLDEIKGLNRLLGELEYIGPDLAHIDSRVRLTAKGWLRIDDLSKSISTSDSAFIAMWYNPLTARFREAAIHTVTACGYKPIIVDDTEFNGFIMDEVITLIRQARFLIADLTCMPEEDSETKVTGGVRGGVYWEAGMAYGMGKPVIQTCMATEESNRRIHFDLKQYRTIFWKEDELITDSIINLINPVKNPSFAQELAQNIMVTVGKGSYTSSSE